MSSLFEVTKSLIYNAPAIKFPQSFAEYLGGTAKLIVLKGADDNDAKRICRLLNIDTHLEGMASLMDEVAKILRQLPDSELERLQVREWLPDELEGSAIMLRDKTEVTNVNVQNDRPG